MPQCGDRLDAGALGVAIVTQTEEQTERDYDDTAIMLSPVTAHQLRTLLRFGPRRRQVTVRIYPRADEAPPVVMAQMIGRGTRTAPTAPAYLRPTPPPDDGQRGEDL
jgi:hypothetical protein